MEEEYTEQQAQEQAEQPRAEAKAEEKAEQVEVKTERAEHTEHREHKEHKEKKPSQSAQMLKGWWDRFKRFYLECRRVLKVTQKPTKHEALTVIKISALGMLIIGAIGFVIKMAQVLLFKGGL